MAQTWRDLLFAHWTVPAGALRALIPEPLTIDRFDGSAWLGITPFEVSGVRLRGGTPPLPWRSRFPELNVRTYVSLGGKPGIWFFSLAAARALAVAAARRTYRLPYFHAHMTIARQGDRLHYRSRCSASERQLVAATSEEPGMYAEAVVDGSRAKIWAPTATPASVTVDLRQKQTVGRVVTRWTDTLPSSSRILTSPNGDMWSAATVGPDGMLASPTTARNVRVEITRSSTERTGLRELELYSD